MRAVPRLLRHEHDVALRGIEDRQVRDLVVDRPLEDEPELRGYLVEVSLVLRVVFLRQAADHVRERTCVRHERPRDALAGRERAIEIEERTDRVAVVRLAADAHLHRSEERRVGKAWRWRE